MFKRIYIGAIEPYMLYGHGAWGNRLHLKTVDRILNGIQRRPLIKMTRAFRTTPTDALQVIAGILLLTLKAVEVYSKFLVLTVKVNATVGKQELLWNEVEMKEDIYIRHYADWIWIPFLVEGPVGEDIQIYINGSRIDNKIGSAMVVYCHGTEILHQTCRLEDTATVFQAETKGKKMPLDYINETKLWHKFHVFSDSKSVLQSLASSKNTRQSILELKELYGVVPRDKWVKRHWVEAHVGVTGNESADCYAKFETNKDEVDFKCPKSKATIIRVIRNELVSLWQNHWDRSGNGKHTYKYIPNVGLKVKSFSLEITQFLTAHRRFPAYFYRFNLSREYSCSCCSFRSVEHFIKECHYTRDNRLKLSYDVHNPPSILTNKNNLIHIQKIIQIVNSLVPQT
ncbi:hypothetical protein AVEN_156924-1 [Araneus ventricosus]|uniref:RNase H type-1 domain-containing protein n=1 Tax=Araneus ventricosus TaxID=182803 RepID=A0A4Y2EP15_ARAVE|nr:hypothetical protein AVEN_156924-1 [Araneus ventricosus]